MPRSSTRRMGVPEHHGGGGCCPQCHSKVYYLRACGNTGMNRPPAFPSMDKHQRVTYNMDGLIEIIRMTLPVHVFIMQLFWDGVCGGLNEKCPSHPRTGSWVWTLDYGSFRRWSLSGGIMSLVWASGFHSIVLTSCLFPECWWDVVSQLPAPVFSHAFPARMDSVSLELWSQTKFFPP